MSVSIRKIVITAIIAALYAVLTLMLGFMSYGPIQFRVAEVMMLLPFISKEYILALTLGCFLANVIGPYGLPDIIFGTLATFISAYLVYLTSKYMTQKKIAIVVASLWPTIINAIIIGTMLNTLFGYPLILGMLEVGFGEFVVITIVGVPLFKILNDKYGVKLKNELLK